MTEWRHEALEQQVNTAHTAEIFKDFTKDVSFKAPAAFRAIQFTLPKMDRGWMGARMSRPIGPIFGYRWDESEYAKQYMPKVPLPYIPEQPYPPTFNSIIHASGELWNYSMHRVRSCHPKDGKSPTEFTAPDNNYAHSVELHEYQPVELQGRKMMSANVAPFFALYVSRLFTNGDGTISIDATSEFLFSEERGIVAADYVKFPPDYKPLKITDDFFDEDAPEPQAIISGSTLEAWRYFNHYIDQIDPTR